MGCIWFDYVYASQSQNWSRRLSRFKSSGSPTLLKMETLTCSVRQQYGGLDKFTSGHQPRTQTEHQRNIHYTNSHFTRKYKFTFYKKMQIHSLQENTNSFFYKKVQIHFYKKIQRS